MSGSTTTMIASTLPVSVVCTGTVAGDGVEPYTVTLVGASHPQSVSGTGITYDVDLASFDAWIAVNAGFAESIRTITQAEIDDLINAEDEYGFELNLEDDAGGGTLAAGRLSLGEARTIAQVAAQRARDAAQQLRDADNARKMADLQTEAANAERAAAEELQKQAMAIIDEKTHQNTPTPAPEPRRARRSTPESSHEA